MSSQEVEDGIFRFAKDVRANCLKGQAKNKFFAIDKQVPNAPEIGRMMDLAAQR